MAETKIAGTGHGTRLHRWVQSPYDGHWWRSRCGYAYHETRLTAPTDAWLPKCKRCERAELGKNEGQK